MYRILIMAVLKISMRYTPSSFTTVATFWNFWRGLNATLEVLPLVAPIAD
jgi:hypothetical protein